MSIDPDHLIRTFDELPIPNSSAGPDRFAARAISDCPACHIAKDRDGQPVFLVNAVSGDSTPATPLVILEHVSVHHGVDCRLQAHGSEAEVHRLSIVRCNGKDRVLHEYFLRSLAPILQSLPAKPTHQQVADAVNTLVELFRRLSQPPRKTVRGLWAELFLIAQSRDPARMIVSWHDDPREHFDFATTRERLEVKGFAGEIRSHCFSYEQLHPPGGTMAFIASLRVESSVGGKSIADLVADIRERVPDCDLLIRLDAEVAQTLGIDWRDAHSLRYDCQGARESLRFFAASTVPSVASPVPPEVSDVGFRVDLSGVLPLKIGLLEQGDCDLVKAAIPPILSEN